jgi:hypothetical protein
MIRATGDKLTLCVRLVELLERRRDDLAVRAMALRRWDQGDNEIINEKSGEDT